MIGISTKTWSTTPATLSEHLIDISVDSRLFFQTHHGMLVNTWASQLSSDCWLRCWWSVNLVLTGFLIEMLVECWSSVDWVSIEMLIECRSRCRWGVDLVLIKMSMGHFPSIYCWLSIDWDVNQELIKMLMEPWWRTSIDTQPLMPLVHMI